MQRFNSAGFLIVLAALCISTAGLTAPEGRAAQPVNDIRSFNPMDVIMCDTDKECEEATGYPYDVTLSSPNPPKYPRLVGIDCYGIPDGAPIYVFEETHLPACRIIMEMDWEWRDKL
jgi:hypothetical protein